MPFIVRDCLLFYDVCYCTSAVVVDAIEVLFIWDFDVCWSYTQQITMQSCR